MDMIEYNKVRFLRYDEYCDYLHMKYGIPEYDYMTKSYNKNVKCTRTKEGLIAHHKMEDRAINLARKDIAQMHPIEWQYKENIVFCDYLEHLLLHLKICQYQYEDRVNEEVGIGGMLAYMIPELNDVYSGWQTKQEWRKNCYDKIINKKELYLQIIKETIIYLKDNKPEYLKYLCKSAAAPYGQYDEKNNAEIYKAIQELIDITEGYFPKVKTTEGIDDIEKEKTPTTKELYDIEKEEAIRRVQEKARYSINMFLLKLFAIIVCAIVFIGVLILKDYFEQNPIWL
jgi:hypothetical protein